jgi:hypothetical protein
MGDMLSGEAFFVKWSFVEGHPVSESDSIFLFGAIVKGMLAK